tara:strand:- start:380 stop:577 length:198 start_codon:yes stop_codon:yes gene_type:complete
MNALHKVTLSEKQIKAIVEFIDCWNVVDQLDYEEIDEVRDMLQGVVRKHREKVLKAQSKRPEEEW